MEQLIPKYVLHFQNQKYFIQRKVISSVFRLSLKIDKSPGPVEDLLSYLRIKWKMFQEVLQDECHLINTLSAWTPKDEQTLHVYNWEDI